MCTETVAGVPEKDSSSLIVETVNRIKTTTAATMYQDVLSKIQSKSTQSSQKQATYFFNGEQSLPLTYGKSVTDIIRHATCHKHRLRFVPNGAIFYALILGTLRIII